MHQNLEARNFIFFLLYMHFGRQHAVKFHKGIDRILSYTVQLYQVEDPNPKSPQAKKIWGILHARRQERSNFIYEGTGTHTGIVNRKRVDRKMGTD